MAEDPSFVILTLAVALVAAIFVLTYYRKIIYAKKEYDTAKEFISGIVITFKRRLEEQIERIDGVEYDIEGLQSTVEKEEKENYALHERIENLIKSLTSVFMVNKKVMSNIMSMSKKLDELKAVDEELDKKIEALKEGYQRPSQRQEEIERPEKKPSSTGLTVTEEQVLQVLLSEGPKTAPGIEKAIGKTREHTSRLMKKLWREGYVERDNHTIPFTYRPTKELEERTRIQT